MTNKQLFSKKKYEKPEIKIFMLDNSFSLALESIENPPGGPNEIYVSNNHCFNSSSLS